MASASWADAASFVLAVAGVGAALAASSSAARARAAADAALYESVVGAASCRAPFIAPPAGSPGAPPEVEHLGIPFLCDLAPGAPRPGSHDSPLVGRSAAGTFVRDGETVVGVQAVGGGGGGGGDDAAGGGRAVVRSYVAAGPSRRVAWRPADVTAAIVTCGGLCPGLNTVVREIVMCLHYVYGVPEGRVWGVPGGYAGFYGPAPWLPLTPDAVSAVHRQGGTFLGSSRGGFDAERILDALVARGVTFVFITGGDGTHRGALALLRAAAARGLPLAVAGVPKTIDNDIALLDKTFGYDTAIEQAVRPIECANTEAKAAQGGVGLVKLMGRSAGFIALAASLASRDVNVTLLPEAPWRMAKLLGYLEARLAKRGHCVIVVAEGAESVEQRDARAAAAAAPPPAGGAGGAAAAPAQPHTDASGNVLKDEDVGVYIKASIERHFKARGQPATVKYIDPSYVIRASPPNSADSLLCTSLAFNAVHGAFSGRTGFTVGTVDGAFVLLPIALVATQPPRQVDVGGRMYARMCITSGQPDLA